MPALHSYTVAVEEWGVRRSGEDFAPGMMRRLSLRQKKKKKSSQPNPTCTALIQWRSSQLAVTETGRQLRCSVIYKQKVIFFSWKKKVRGKEGARKTKRKQTQRDKEGERERRRRLFRDELEEKEDRAARLKESWVGNERDQESEGCWRSRRSYQLLIC